MKDLTTKDTKEEGLRPLPDGWTWIKLGSIAEVDWGNTSLTKKSYVDEGFPAFSATGQDGLLPHSEHDGDAIIVSAIGARCGKCFFARGKWTAIKNTITIISNDLEKINPRFLFYYLNDENIWPKRGVGQPFITIGNARKVPVPIPPITEQERILARLEELLSDLEAGVAALERVRLGVKRYKASVLKAACEGKLFGDKEIVNGNLREGWRWMPVGDIGKVSGGITKNSKRNTLAKKLPYLRVANVYANELKLDDVAEIGVSESEIQRVLLENGDLLVVEGNGSAEQIGRVAIWNGSISPCLHQNHIIKVRFNPPEIAEYVLYWLLSKGGREHITDVASSTSGLYTLNLSKVASLPVPLPPLEEQRRIVAEVERRLESERAVEVAVEAGLQRAAKLRQAVLRSAFEGRLK